MAVNFQIKNLNGAQFANLFQLNEVQLLERGAIKQKVDQYPGFPCRVSLEDAQIGEEVILFAYKHHDVLSPYKAEGPIFVRKKVAEAKLAINEVPKMLLHRLLSLRAYNKSGMMIKAKTVEGANVQQDILALFEEAAVEYIHVHNASPGCFNCEVIRA